MGGASNFTYDANGDMVTRVDEPNSASPHTVSYTWDSLGRLTQLQDPATPVDSTSQQLNFGYDHDGRRNQLTVMAWNSTISSWNTVATEYYLWDGNQIVQKRTVNSDAGNISAEYFTYGFQAYSGGAWSGNYYYTKDHLK